MNDAPRKVRYEIADTRYGAGSCEGLGHISERWAQKIYRRCCFHNNPTVHPWGMKETTEANLGLIEGLTATTRFKQSVNTGVCGMAHWVSYVELLTKEKQHPHGYHE